MSPTSHYSKRSRFLVQSCIMVCFNKVHLNLLSARTTHKTHVIFHRIQPRFMKASPTNRTPNRVHTRELTFLRDEFCCNTGRTKSHSYCHAEEGNSRFIHVAFLSTSRREIGAAYFLLVAVLVAGAVGAPRIAGPPDDNRDVHVGT